MKWPESEQEAISYLERGVRYFPDVNPNLFMEAAEFRLYFAMIECHEKQTACLARNDFLGALKAASELVKEGGLV